MNQTTTSRPTTTPTITHMTERPAKCARCESNTADILCSGRYDDCERAKLAGIGYQFCGGTPRGQPTRRTW